MAESRMTCDELVALVQAQGPGGLKSLKWLDELVDVTGAAEFTGLAVESVRTLSKPAMRALKAERGQWAWPEPDHVFGGRQVWKLRTIVLARASMPGQGRGGPPRRTRYDAAFKANAVRAVRSTGMSVARAALNLGVNEHTLAAWVAADRRHSSGL
jgi:hypothetical protein